MTYYTHTLYGLLLTVGLVACGGGNSGDSESVSGSENATQDASPSDGSPIADETVTMTTIKVAPDYDFTTSQQLDVEVDLRAITNQRSYISFFQQWSDDDDTPIPNPDSQLFMQATDSGLLNHTLTVGKQQQSLLMMVMFSETQYQPVTKVFAVDTNNGFQYP